MGEQAVDLYNRIPAQMRNNVINLCALNACSHSGLVDAARLIFNDISPKSEMITTAMVRHFHLFVQVIDCCFCSD